MKYKVYTNNNLSVNNGTLLFSLTLLYRIPTYKLV